MDEQNVQQNVQENPQTYTTRSCRLCSNVDSDEMVQCDSCDLWFHFQCVNVTSDIEHHPWICESCFIFGTASNEPMQKKGAAKSGAVGSIKSSKRSLSARQKARALKQLEEEQAIRLDVLHRKYRVLASSDDESDDKSQDSSKQSSMERTSKWTSEVQDISANFSKISLKDCISVSSSDHDREVLNLLRPEQFKDVNSRKNVIGPSVLSTKSNDPDRQSVPASGLLQKSDMTTSAHQDDTLRTARDMNQRQSVPNRVTINTPNVNQSSRMNVNQGHANDPAMVTTHRSRTSIAANNMSNVYQPATMNSNYGINACHASNPSNTNFGPNNLHTPNPHQRLANNARTPQSIGVPNVVFGVPSAVPIGGQSQSGQLNHGKRTSGYVSQTSGQLTSNQIAARHVFKELPEFHGNPEEWPLYLSALIHSTVACGYTDSENLGRLQRTLKGEIMSTFRCRLVHPESVPGVVETLHLIFGRETPTPRADDLGSLIKFAIAVQNLSTTIQSSNELEYLQNPILIQTVIDKLPSQTQLNWAFYKATVGVADLKTLGDWLYRLAEVATSVVNPSTFKFNDKSKKTKNQESTKYTNAHSGSDLNKSSTEKPKLNKAKCPVCDTSSHKLAECRKFKQQSVEEKWNIVKKNKICGRCFDNHHWTKCKSIKKCGTDGCNANHHVLLHNTIAKTVVHTPEMPETQAVQHSSNSHRTLLDDVKNPDVFRIVPVILSYNDKSIQIFAFLDYGSNLTSLEESVADSIGAHGTMLPLCVIWAMKQSHRVETTSRQVSVSIRGTFDGAQKFNLEHVRTVKKLNLPTQSVTRNWRRLHRAVAYVLRFIHNIKAKGNQNRRYGVFSSEELLLAESFLYMRVQHDAFGDELAIIRHNEGASSDNQREFPRDSAIRTTSAYIDDYGVMRVQGRIDAASSISDTMKRPIILNRHHYVTQLIVDFYHRRFKHLNQQTVLNEVRQVFYIPRLRVLLKQVRDNCQRCKNRLVKPQIPEMASLPQARLAINMRAFTYTGVDYFGPLKVVYGRGTAKRWGVLFTCLTTRAIHLEIAYSLETGSCIMAIYNFIGRRGQPKTFYSDNGTNFHGAENTLKKLRQEFGKLDQDRIQEEFTTSEFSWTFNPPVAPHMVVGNE